MIEETLYSYSFSIGLFLGFIIGIFVIKEHWGPYYSLIKNLFYSLLRLIGSMLGIGISTVVLVFLSVGIYSKFVDHTEVEKHYLYPVSINREKDIQGDFVLGSGTIESINYYYFYYKSIYGYKLSKIDATNTYIIETNERQPQIVEVVKSFDQNTLIKLSDSQVVLRNIIYVPKNTIIKQFILK